MSFRPRLYSIPDEKSLWNYFSKNAKFLENKNVYTIAGIYAADTAILYNKLIEEWKNDIEVRKDEIVEDTLKVLNRR